MAIYHGRNLKINYIYMILGNFIAISEGSRLERASIMRVHCLMRCHCYSCHYIHVCNTFRDIPESVPSSAVNRQCSSGLQAVMNVAGMHVHIYNYQVLRPSIIMTYHYINLIKPFLKYCRYCPLWLVVGGRGFHQEQCLIWCRY